VTDLVLLLQCVDKVWMQYYQVDLLRALLFALTDAKSEKGEATWRWWC